MFFPANILDFSLHRGGVYVKLTFNRHQPKLVKQKKNLKLSIKTNLKYPI